MSTVAPSIAHYIKEIGRGKDGARSLTREQAADLLTLVLSGAVSDLEVGAFCLAMRIKGETREELMGFMDAAEAQIHATALQGTRDKACTRPIVVIPSYNGARKLPLLTPLLALLLAREGCHVLIHGMDEGQKAVSGVQRVTSAEIFNQLAQSDLSLANVQYVSIAKLAPALKKLLDVRKVVGLRNSAHSVVKLINPYRHAPHVRSVLVSSYTHPEYAVSMREAVEGFGATALLLRGTEGEAVADPRRTPVMTGLRAGKEVVLQAMQHGTLGDLPDLPTTIDAPPTAAYIRAALAGATPIPAPIRLQVAHILKLL
ncbi:MAG: DNA-binding protein YbiB [Cytophagales bacterium]|nr:DNA-binding protein YbiB [Cytophagales bacterium]